MPSEEEVSRMLDEIEKGVGVPTVGVVHAFSQWVAPHTVVDSVVHVWIYKKNGDETKVYDFGEIGWVEWLTTGQHCGRANLRLSTDHLKKLVSLLTDDMNAFLRNQIQKEALDGAQKLIYKKYPNTEILRRETGRDKDFVYEIDTSGDVGRRPLPSGAELLPTPPFWAIE